MYDAVVSEQLQNRSLGGQRHGNRTTKFTESICRACHSLMIEQGERLIRVAAKRFVVTRTIRWIQKHHLIATALSQHSFKVIAK